MVPFLIFLVLRISSADIHHMRFAIDPPKASAGIAFKPPASAQLGQACNNNVTCGAFNAFCSNNGTCACLPNFVEDPTERFCIQAPFYNQPCAKGVCHSPFTCNASDVCTCPAGFIEEFMQCVKECASNEVAIDNVCHETKWLGQSCDIPQQCSTLYSSCANEVCKCIDGTEEQSGSCSPRVVCPSGVSPLMQGENYKECTAGDNKSCFPGYYCMPTEPNQKTGYCCSKPELKCPVGKALADRNCTNCPWDTHHCYSYVVSGYSGSMCCPNACPSSQPIKSKGRCFAGVAFGGRCEIDEQCYSVAKSVCRPDQQGEKRCICPPGPYAKEFGQCLKRVYHGGRCETMKECRGNTHCTEGTCLCMAGWLKAEADPICIPKAICPMPIPPERVNSTHPSFCNNKSPQCGTGTFCHMWWKGPVDETGRVKEFAHCCPEPEPVDFELLCQPYSLKLDYEPDGQPSRCDLNRAHSTLHQLVQERLRDDPATNSTGRVCRAGSACIFDPYTVSAGVCCAHPVATTPLTVDEETE